MMLQSDPELLEEEYFEALEKMIPRYEVLIMKEKYDV